MYSSFVTVKLCALNYLLDAKDNNYISVLIAYIYSYLLVIKPIKLPQFKSTKFVIPILQIIETILIPDPNMLACNSHRFLSFFYIYI